MQELPTISIVTPVFNGARFLQATIESVLAQDYPRVEYIVQDGGSTDATLEILSRYGARVSVASEPDTGMYDAVNKGFARAKGSILTYLNSDDVLLPGALAAAARAAATGAQLIFGNCQLIDGEGNEIYRLRTTSLAFDQAVALGRLPFLQPGTFWSRSLHERVGGFDTKFRYAADTAFLYRALRAASGRHARVPDYLAAFRVHDAAISSRLRDAHGQEHHAVLAELGARGSWLARYALEGYVKARNIDHLLLKYARKLAA